MSRERRLGRFAAWVEIDGERAQQYGDGMNWRTSTCFIVSRHGAELAIYVQEYPSSSFTCARADVYVEGVHIGKALLSPSKGPCSFMGSWESCHSVRPLVFTKANISRATDSQAIVKGSGKIVVEISEVVASYTIEDEEGWNTPPQPLKNWQPPMVSEEDENIGRHSIILSKTIKRRTYEPQLQVFLSKPVDNFNPEPIAIFEFVYGSKEFVFRSLKELESVESFFSSSDSPAGAPRLIPEQPPVKYRSHKKHAHTRVIGSYSPPRSSETKCTRCTKAGVQCVPNGGASLTCQRCRKLKSRCDLPERRQRSPKEHQQTIQKTLNNLLRKRPNLPTNVPNEWRTGASATPKDSAPHNSSESQSRKTVDESAGHTPSDGTALHDLEAHRPRHRSSSISEKDAGSRSSLQHRSRAARVPKSKRRKGQNMMMSDPNNDRRATTEYIETDSNDASKIASSTHTGDASQVGRTVETIRTFSEQLMELVATSEPNGIVADVAMQLVNYCDSSSRRLQADILQSRRTRN